MCTFNLILKFNVKIYISQLLTYLKVNYNILLKPGLTSTGIMYFQNQPSLGAPVDAFLVASVHTWSVSLPEPHNPP